MTEGLFILTTIFVAYVVYQVVNDQKKTSKSGDQVPAKKVEPVAATKPQTQPAAKKEAPAVATKPQPVAQKAPVSNPKPQPSAKKEAPPAAAAPKPAIVQSKSNPAPASAPTAAKTGLRDPKTGEVVNASSNYRFIKRWVKDALVAEGLLTKVYKNNELTDEVEAQIKDALSKLEAMDKYRA